VEKECYTILIFGHNTSKSRHLKIPRKTVRIITYLLGFAFLSLTFFLCDYVQVKKRGYELSLLRKETQVQKSQIHFFSSRIETIEKQLSKLKDFDKRIRIIANLDKGQEPSPFMGMGGPSPSDIRDKMTSEKDEDALARQMKADLDRLQSETFAQEQSLSELEKELESKKDVLAHTPSIWPVAGWVTSNFGFRTNPFTGLTQMHEGLDVSNRVGTPIIAPADGIVSNVGNDEAHGRMVVLSHGFGITSRYCHLSKANVKVGQKVRRGDKIAEVGMTGKTTGPHLHYEVRLNGIPANPTRYILN
jgi:hypothetical protein